MGDAPRPFRIAAAACILLVLFSAVRAAASQVVVNSEESLDWKIADADLIVVGRVVAVRWVTGGGGWWRQVNTVEVSETFKGPTLDRLEYAGRETATRPNPGPAPDWLPAVFFLSRGDRTGVPFPPGRYP